MNDDDDRMEIDNIWEDSNSLMFTPLGSGREVGRSCHILEFKGKVIMLDCGIHPGRDTMNMLPYFDAVDDLEVVDILLISHFHLDHAAALPYLTEHTSFKGRILMTNATKAVLRLVLNDYARILANDPKNEPLYTQEDLAKCLKKCETVGFHTVVEIEGVKITPYHAGHVLGAAMFLIEIAGVRILYTGDYSRKDDRHLRGAEIPSIRPDLLIVEATFGLMIHESREQREKRFTESVEKIVRRGGNCLIPMGALGAVQELLLILEDYWNKNPDLKGIPIYHTSRIANEALNVYRAYINTMNDEMRNSQLRDPWSFENIGSLEESEEIVGPAVVLASPGYLQSGKSRKLFEQWCSNRSNGVILAGYSVQGTLAKTLSEQDVQQITSQDETTIIPVECEIKTITFAAHSDFNGTRSFFDQLKPKNVIFVHGEAEQMRKLMNELRRHSKQINLECSFYNPENSKPQRLEFQEQRIVKAYGTERFQNKMKSDGSRISVYLVRTDFTDRLVSTEDLRYYTELTTATIKQTLHLPYNLEFPNLKESIGKLFDCKTNEKEQRLFIGENCVELHLHKKIVKMSWEASPSNDMICDAISAIIMQTNGGIPAVRVGTCCSSHPNHHLHHENEEETKMIQDDNNNTLTVEKIIETSQNASLLMRLLKERFSSVKVESDGIKITANGRDVIVRVNDQGHINYVEPIMNEQELERLEKLNNGEELDENIPTIDPQLLSLQTSVEEVVNFAVQTMHNLVLA